MRITKLFGSVLAALALTYASGCSNNNCEVAGYNVYGNQYTGQNMQAIAYNAAYAPNIAPPPAAVQSIAYYPNRAPQARVRRTKVRYARPTKQRFTQQVNPYVYNQPVGSFIQQPIQQPIPPTTIATNFGQQVPGTATLLSDPNFVPTITTNSDGLLGYGTYNPGVTYNPGITYNPGVTYQQPQVGVLPVQQPNYGVPAGSNVECTKVYRRGRPIGQRFRKVRWVPVGQPPAPAPVYQYQAPLPAPVYTPPVYTPPAVTYTPPPIVEPYTPPPVVTYTPPPVEPVVIPAPAPEPQVIRQEINTVINPVIEPTIEPRIQPRIEPIIEPRIEPQIKPVIEPTIRTRIEPTPVVEQPVQQPIIQPVVIQPIIQPVIQSPIQSQVAPVEIQAPVQVIQQPAPVYIAPPPAPVFTPPPAPAYIPPAPAPEPSFGSEVLGSAYCPPDICPAPNPVVCQPGQNLSECFTLNEYQIQNSPTQIYTPTATGSLPIALDSGGVFNQGAYSTQAVVQSTPMGQTTTSKYEALPTLQPPAGPADFGMPQTMAPTPMAQTDNIPPVPAASEIENALDAMLSRDQRTPNLK